MFECCGWTSRIKSSLGVIYGCWSQSENSHRISVMNLRTWIYHTHSVPAWLHNRRRGINAFEALSNELCYPVYSDIRVRLLVTNSCCVWWFHFNTIQKTNLNNTRENRVSVGMHSVAYDPLKLHAVQHNNNYSALWCGKRFTQTVTLKSYNYKPKPLQ